MHQQPNKILRKRMHHFTATDSFCTQNTLRFAHTHTHTRTHARTHAHASTHPPSHTAHVSFHSRNVICIQNLFQQTPQVTIINFVAVHAKLVHVNLYCLYQDSFLPLFCQIRLIYNFSIASQISRATPILYTSHDNGATN